MVYWKMIEDHGHLILFRIIMLLCDFVLLPFSSM